MLPYNNTRGTPIKAYGAGTHVISNKPCGLVSVVLDIGPKSFGTVTLYDNASTDEGTEIVKLASKTTASYSPCKPDACSNGIVAVIAEAQAGYVVCTFSIE